MTVYQHITIPIYKEDWILQNHRGHFAVTAAKKRAIRETAWALARRDLMPIPPQNLPIAIFARARVRGGTLPDPDAIAPAVKAIIDGIVDARILPDDKGEYVTMVGYGRPETDRTLKPGMREIDCILTNQYMPM